MLKDFLQGKPFQHPLHPLLIHFPIGLFVLSLILDIASFIDGTTDWLVPAAAVCLIGGEIMAVVAAIPGLIDWIDIRSDHPAKKKATLHMILNLGAVALYALSLGLRSNAWNAASTPTLPFILSVIGIGVLSVSGYIGGLLVYEQGIAVGRHLRRTETPRHTLHAIPNGSTVASAEGYKAVASVTDLPPGETLRAEVDGQVMTLVQLDGQFYAFQEFCPHRSGPLSEGSIHDGQIQCPWHGSCFDIRSGKVTRGPAKENLRVYEVSVHNNKLYVRVTRERAKPSQMPVPEKRVA